MNTYYNFAIMAVALTLSLAMSYRMLKLKAENSSSLFLNLNGISLLALNALCWGAALYFSPISSFSHFQKPMILAASLIAVILPFIETKIGYKKGLFIFGYIIAGALIAKFSFDMQWQEITLLAVFWGAFTYLFDPFNGEERIANNSLLFILGGILFLNMFFESELAIVFLAVITGLILIGFNASSKNELIPMQLSTPSLHGFAFIAGMFFVYYASLGYFIIGIIVPAYFIIERIIYGLVFSFKKIFKKDSETFFFFEIALNKGANYAALNKYILTFLCMFIMLAAVYNPNVALLLIACSVFVSIKMIFDMYNWGMKRPTLKDTWKMTISDAKLAADEFKSNIKNAISKNKKKD